MRFLLDGRQVDRRSLWLEGHGISFIDQRRLPGSIIVSRACTLEEQEEAIRTLAVRGAPAIGAFGALALALQAKGGMDPDDAHLRLLSTRPTAVDLRNCLGMVLSSIRTGGPDAGLERAMEISDSIVRSCRLIGEAGVSLIRKGGRVMTHCNAGALATLDWGTALAPIRTAAREGKDPFVWVSETRPLLQGSRLTAWELEGESIRHSVMVDSASGHLMRRGQVDLVIVGADRVCWNGDIANKIGTYEKAVLAKENGLPFYVAFPGTTLDPSCPTGDDVPIEERSEREVLGILGEEGIGGPGTAFNPAFDITPARYITGYVTEEGVLSLESLKDRF